MMDCFIKKIFSGKSRGDIFTHTQFQKFSRGEFKDKAVVIYSGGKDKYSISTTYEYANDFVRMMAEKMSGSKTKVTGAIISTRDLTGQLNFSGKKQFAGVKQYIIDAEMTGKEIMELCSKFPTAFLALSMKFGDSEIKIKPKAPISGKPSTKSSDNSVPKAGFCKLYTTDKNTAESVVFDPEIINGEVKKATINHIFLVNEIILPPDEKDFARMREIAIRKGKIIRIINIDGKEIRKEANFEA